ncbi:MAG TPA: hypothetical protein VN655_13530 [Pseudolabrys sp.]|jgi:hypothetical protein|nr:hypothetical protein [Pseudolabrys sp.]
MSINTKLSVAVAIAMLALGSTAYASDASEIYGGGPSAAIPAAGSVYARSLSPRRHVSRRAEDAYARAGGLASFSLSPSKSMLSPSSLDYEPDLNSH